MHFRATGMDRLRSGADTDELRCRPQTTHAHLDDGHLRCLDRLHYRHLYDSKPLILGRFGGSLGALRLAALLGQNELVLCG